MAGASKPSHDPTRTSKSIDAVCGAGRPVCRTLPDSWEARRIGGQLIEASTSMAMNYRAASRGRSHREFTAKMGIVAAEADETLGWLELIAQLELANGPEQQWLLRESRELVAIFGSSYHTAREKQKAGPKESAIWRSAIGGSTTRRSKIGRLKTPITRSPDRRFF
jgi:four helix bundle protein